MSYTLDDETGRTSKCPCYDRDNRSFLYSERGTRDDVVVIMAIIAAFPPCPCIEEVQAFLVMRLVHRLLCIAAWEHASQAARHPSDQESDRLRAEHSEGFSCPDLRLTRMMLHPFIGVY